MFLNPGYQGTRDFNPQMGQQVQRNPNSHADELLLKVTEMMKNQFGLKPKGLTFSYKRPYPEWYCRGPNTRVPNAVELITIEH